MPKVEPLISVVACAKVNFFLDVLGRRPDGYHDIRSVLVPISLCDSLTIEATDGAVETVTDDTDLAFRDWVRVGDSEENLATRAARLLQAETGHRGGARIRLKKCIPVGGGLGGGSADAAATLVSLNRLWDLGLSQQELIRLALRLGSDVPALVHGGAVCVEGMGEKISSALDDSQEEVPGWWLVLVNPGFAVSTRDIYGRHRPTLTSEEVRFNNILLALREGDAERAGANLHNALEGTVFAKFPLLEIVAENLRRSGAIGVLLSGSGATLFALARDKDHAGQIEERVRASAGPWLWSKVVRTLPDGVMVAHGPLEARV